MIFDYPLLIISTLSGIILHYRLGLSWLCWCNLLEIGNFSKHSQAIKRMFSSKNIIVLWEMWKREVQIIHTGNAETLCLWINCLANDTLRYHKFVQIVTIWCLLQIVPVLVVCGCTQKKFHRKHESFVGGPSRGRFAVKG